MDWSTVLAAATSSFGLTVLTAHGLARTLIQHHLSQALEVKKNELTRELDAQKVVDAQNLERLKSALETEQMRLRSTIEAEIRKEVETQLGEIAVRHQYEYEARRRLYVAIGPLRFQLLLACRDLVGRITAMGERERYVLNLEGYYARSTAYRLLKPIALAALIEEQLALADFSVDHTAIDYLRFKRSVTRILCGDELAGAHPNIDWINQREHLFADSLVSILQSLIARTDENPARVRRFDEFIRKLDVEGWGEFSPLDRLLNEFDIRTKPILWLRLVAYAHSCNTLINQQGSTLGFQKELFNTPQLLQRANDEFTITNLPQLLARIESIALVPL